MHLVDVLTCCRSSWCYLREVLLHIGTGANCTSGRRLPVLSLRSYEIERSPLGRSSRRVSETNETPAWFIYSEISNSNVWFPMECKTLDEMNPWIEACKVD